MPHLRVEIIALTTTLTVRDTTSNEKLTTILNIKLTNLCKGARIPRWLI